MTTNENDTILTSRDATLRLLDRKAYFLKVSNKADDGKWNNICFVIFLKMRPFKLKLYLMFNAMFLCSNVQTIDFCVSVTNQAEWGALWLYNAARGWNVVLTFIIV